MAVSSIHNGWRYDSANSRLDFYYRGTRAGHINATGLTTTGTTTSTGALTVTAGGLTVTAGGATVAAGGLTVGASGATQGVITLGSTGSCGTTLVLQAGACTAANLTFTLPSADGCCGHQLTTDGCGALSFAAACSVREHKFVLGETCKVAAYDRVRNTTIYDFDYRPGYGIKSTHPYTGIMQDEAPWAMQGGKNNIFSPINAFGNLTAAVQVLSEKVEKLEAQTVA